MSRKVNIARLSVFSNTLLILLKFAVGIMTRSVSIISEAVHSLMDLAAALIAFFSVKFADKPPDKSHPYGHEKIENISGVIEAILIVLAAVFIIIEGVKKLIHNEHVENIGWGIGVMFVSSAVNIAVSRKLYKVAKEENSVALEADALHLKVDVYTSFGVGLGLLLLYITDYHILDPIIAILVALFILKEAYEMLVKAYNPLIDTRLAEEDVKKIDLIIGRYNNYFTDIHELRSRQAGKIKHIDLHMVAPENMTIKEYHETCDLIENDIENALSNTSVLVHIEPCGCLCSKCRLKGTNVHCKDK